MSPHEQALAMWQAVAEANGMSVDELMDLSPGKLVKAVTRHANMVNRQRRKDIEDKRKALRAKARDLGVRFPEMGEW